MKTKYILIFILFILPVILISQGYKKFYKPSGYTFRSPIALQASEAGTTGFFMYSQSGKTNVEISSIDSFGMEELIHSIPNDSVHSSVQTALQANHSTIGHSEGQIIFVNRQSRPLKLKIHSYFPDSGELTSFEYIPPVQLVGFRILNVIKVDDGYLITGDWVIQSEHPRGFIMAVNKDFSLRYWKWYSTPNPNIEIYGAIEKEDYYLLYGFIQVHPNTFGWFYKKVKKENGEELVSEVFTTNPHCYRLYVSEDDTSKYVCISTYATLDKSELTPSWVLLDENFNVLKQTDFGIRFYQMQRVYFKIEYPYHSARDAEGNYIIATQQILPMILLPQPEGPFIEVLCLTKISTDGDVLWETRDSVVYYHHDNSWGVGNITGLTTGPDNEIYVLGDVQDIDTTINQFKSVGYIFKYDKDGCRVENCRISNVTSAEFNEQLTVYPNPVYDFLKVKIEGNLLNGYEIYDFQGSLLERNSQLKESIDVSQYIPGIYILSVYDNNSRRYNKKFVKM